MKTCLNRFLGRCDKECKRDYNPKHYPNNYDCPDYYEINIGIVKVIDKKDRRNIKNAVDRKT
ncbi:hypothetical protein KAT24_00510 [Candidatus Pacearchaeota archaeon]|nr:hypothetical protein [Candidatus Pacearchaeota archaeon]